ncbi:MAG TPA: hypothetical protein VN256_22975 [Pyrinomonadaceae bacterium]|nr:hypothetical protein [Pyrinomonadaceae bacterium]
MADPSHFKFYSVTTLPADRTVKLRGQFERDGKPKLHKAVKLSHFGIPVSKNGERIPDKITHLNWYELSSTTEPPRKVEVSNQFSAGTHLEIGDPSVLLVPALKLPLDKPLASDDKLPGGVSHFKCYRVVKGDAPTIRGGEVVLEDQFDLENQVKMETAVGVPVYFCVPVSKILVKSGGVETPPTTVITSFRDHLVIYKIKELPYKQERQVFDQFDETRERLRRLSGFTSRYLAVPSKKVRWSPA